MAKMVKVSVSVDKESLRLAKAQARKQGVSLSALLTRGLQHELDAQARLEAAIELYGPDGWPTAERQREILESWVARSSRPRSHRKAA